VRKFTNATRNAASVAQIYAQFQWQVLVNSLKFNFYHTEILFT